MSNREIELQRQLDAARQQIQRLREAAQRIIDDYTWDDVNKEVEAWVSSQYLYADIVTLRDTLRETEPQP